MSMESEMRFPVVVCYANDMTVYETVDGLTVCRSNDLSAGDQGRFARATIVDSEGVAYRMVGAERIDRPSWFRWLSLLSHRKFRAKIRYEGEPSTIDLENFRLDIARRLSTDKSVTLVLGIGCATLGEAVAGDLVPAVMQAASARQIIAILANAPFPERERWVDLAKPALDAP